MAAARDSVARMKVFPTRLFYFQGHAAGLERRTVSGGTSLSGEEDVIATDGGGRVTVQFSEADLDEPEAAVAWRALDVLTEDGAEPIIVPLGDARHQMMGDVTTPMGGLPWWEEADFAPLEPLSVLTAASDLRATTIAATVSDLPGPVRPGLWLSIDHPTWRHRAYRVREVLSDDGATATLTIRPPLREATPAGTAVEWVDPKCTCRVADGMPSPTTLGYAEGSVSFVEWPGAPA